MAGGGRGGKGGGERLCMDRDLRDGSGGGMSVPLLLLEDGQPEEHEVFVTNEQSCKTQQRVAVIKKAKL